MRQQRHALPQAILGRPRLLIFDEPTADLDPVGRRDVRNMIASSSPVPGLPGFMSDQPPGGSLN